MTTNIAGVEIRSATRVASGIFDAGGGQGIRVPGSCRVVAVARPTRDSEIGFELWLPDGWNGRYAQLGNGGFAGNIDQPSLAAEIRRGNAAAMTDTGHKGSQFDASWALGHPVKVIDYGYRSTKVTADAAKRLIDAYFGRAPRRRYFIGCSNGGRQALIAAQRFPGDWDGILAGSPIVQWTRQLATFAAIQHRLRSKPENWIPATKLPAIQRAATAACPDAALGCRLDVSRLICRDTERDHCLTSAQAATLELIQSGPRDSRGARRSTQGSSRAVPRFRTIGIAGSSTPTAARKATSRSPPRPIAT
jgi:feruloyl esterase